MSSLIRESMLLLWDESHINIAQQHHLRKSALEFDIASYELARVKFQ
jgi:hypothetical protein